MGRELPLRPLVWVLYRQRAVEALWGFLVTLLISKKPSSKETSYFAFLTFLKAQSGGREAQDTT